MNNNQDEYDNFGQQYRDVHSLVGSAGNCAPQCHKALSAVRNTYTSHFSASKLCTVANRTANSCTTSTKDDDD